MVAKAFGLSLLAALQKRQDAACVDYCPYGTMTIELSPTKTVIQQPIRVTGYFTSNGPITLGEGYVAIVTGAPGRIDTVITLDKTKTQNNVM